MVTRVNVWGWLLRFCCSMCAVLSFVALSHAQGAKLSEQELAQLAAGELVTRPQSTRRGRRQLMGGTSYQVIELPPAAVFKALLDTESYRYLLPEVSRARLVARNEDLRKVYIRQGSGPIQVEYYLDLTIDADAREVAFRLDEERPAGIRAAFGLYSLHPYGPGHTLLVYGIMADIGDGILRSLVRASVHEWMLKVPWMIKRYVEGSGRKRYLDAGEQPLPAVQVLAPVSQRGTGHGALRGALGAVQE